MNPTAHTTLITAPSSRPCRPTAAAPVVIDVGFDLADTTAGERRYRDAHLPGAHYLHLDRDLSGAKTGRNGRHPLPARADFARTIGALGVAPGTQVVAVDAHGGVYAARLWWMLRWLGHGDVAVLDGGVQAWQSAGGALTNEPTPQPNGPAYPERPSLAQTVDAVGVATRAARARRCSTRGPASAFAARSSRSMRSPGTSQARSIAFTRPTSTPAARSSRRPSCAPSSSPPSATARRTR